MTSDKGMATKKKVEPQQLTITVNSAVLSLLKRDQLDINHLFILLSLNGQHIELLDQYDDENKRTEVLMYQYQYMFMHGFIEHSEGDVTYQITQKGKDFLKELEPKKENFDFKGFCKAYVDLFPKVKLPSGKYARSGIAEIEKKMAAFLKKNIPAFKKTYGFEVTANDILQATKTYIARYEKKGYQYMVTSSYFIQKNEVSALADEILAMKEGVNKANTNFKGM
jgi:hypothetical protein